MPKFPPERMLSHGIFLPASFFFHHPTIPFWFAGGEPKWWRKECQKEPCASPCLSRTCREGRVPASLEYGFKNGPRVKRHRASNVLFHFIMFFFDDDTSMASECKRPPLGLREIKQVSINPIKFSEFLVACICQRLLPTGSTIQIEPIPLQYNL